MITVHKYILDPFNNDNPHNKMMPLSAKVLTAREQNEQVCVWVQINTENDVLYRKFYLVGTGHPMDQLPLDIRYVGSAQLMNGTIILHVYDGGYVK